MSSAKGVYKKPSGNFIVVTWNEERKLSYHGTYDSEEEAKYMRDNLTPSHHWLGLEPEPDRYGYVYKVVNFRTKQLYFGRRVYSYYNKETGARDIEGNWEFYTSGSKVIQEMFNEEPENLEATILAHTDSNDESSVIEWSLINSYMTRKLPTEEPMCLNKVLPKLFYNGLEIAKGTTAHTIQRLLKELP